MVVVGGGIGGLTTAALLARGGARVTLLERSARVGGRAGTLEQDGFRFDTGPSWYLMPEAFDHAFALLGERVEDHLDLVELDPAYRVFPEPELPGEVSQPLDVSAEPEKNWATFEALEPGAGEAVRRYVEGSTLAYRTALDHFLYTTFERPDRALGRDVLARLGTLGGLLTETMADRIAGTVQHPVLRQVLGYHGVFLGSSPYRLPALYSLMSHLDLADKVRYAQGGMYTLIEALERLARREGVDLRTGVEVTTIEVDDALPSLRRPRRTGRVRGVRLADGSVLPADVVVSAADRHHTETELLEERHADLPPAAWDQHGPGISALLVMVGVRGELPQLPHHSLFFTADWPANFAAILGDDAVSDPATLHVPETASLYVSRTTATDPSAAPPGHENLFVLVPFPADPSLGADPASRERMEAAADRALDQVAAWAGISDLRQRVVTRRVVTPADFARDLHAWRGTALGMEHTLRQSALFRPGNASRHVDGLLHVGGGTVPGVGLPMCLISAELVVKRLLGETSAAPLPAPLRPGYLAASLPRGLWQRLTVAS
ncbi:phytoene desaturase [Cellulomonas marina]|nr:phytoene desaturase [Cellulomonas marina]